MLRTPHWFLFSQKVREFWGNRCAVCYADGLLVAHHRTYERFGHEELTDCVALCERCHAFADDARVAGREQEQGSRLVAALNGRAKR